ncbi:TonB-dependent receptor plug domain-containing protein [Geomonas oryzisoli]|uniref:TonB-dependent receptor plug domain-containing protein n=1 Tax=Geomonas oryzisoli TaxID=2847992 RepID=A0ABX8J5R3_9BACT|nr:TonB-dependent receptor plug domain-containing protein [Geomonas oryzisoli]QWV92416.1 TonB-dependent receptor plug domain-containing protein [Geomonas oryzisoli]
MTVKFLRKFLLVSLLLLIPLAPHRAMAEQEDEVTRSLGLSEEQPDDISRLPRPASLIAENVTVVTADEIARLNAHTVADVLQTIPGVQMDLLQTPGGILLYDILGSPNRHVLVQIDGVPQNFVSAENLAHVGMIPIQMIERIEVVKGAASAAWGSALGGVINIVTKAPVADRGAAGLASASIGKKATSDLRGEVSGTSDGFGYYLTGGTIRSDGLRGGNNVDFSHGFGKITYDFLGGAKATLGLDARYADTGTMASTRYNLAQTGATHYLDGYLALQVPLAERASLEVTGRGGVRDSADRRTLLAPGLLVFNAQTREVHQGYTAALNLGDAHQGVKTGLEFERIGVSQAELVQHRPGSDADLSLTRYSAYANGTFTVGRLSLLPGVRVDHLNLLDDAVSATLGATVRLGENTLMRGYAARGYSLPLISFFGSTNGEVQHELQQVTTVQWGMESSAIPYLWLKGMLFNNNVWNVQEYDYQAGVMLKQRQRRQGVDLELRTSPWYGFALTGAYTFTDAINSSTGAELDGSLTGPRHAVKGSLSYNNTAAGLTCVVTGNYTDWKLDTPGAHPVATLFDLHVNQKLMPSQDNSPELFFSVRNIFDAKLYQYDFHQAAPRWFEIGGRFRF